MLAERLPDMWDIRRDIVQDYLKRLQKCLALAGKRGGAPGDIPGMIARLAMWLRTNDGSLATYNRLVNDAGFAWDEWYDWYSRIYTRPNELLFGLSFEEWGALMYE